MAQDNSSSSVAQRHQKVEHPCATLTLQQHNEKCVSDWTVTVFWIEIGQRGVREGGLGGRRHVPFQEGVQDRPW